MGRIAIVDEVLYEAGVAPQTISTRNRPAQVAAARAAVAWRDDPREENLRQAVSSGGVRDANEAGGYYFIAACLHRRKDPRWRRYAWEAVRRNPFHLRAWVRLLLPF